MKKGLKGLALLLVLTLCVTGCNFKISIGENAVKDEVNKVKDEVIDKVKDEISSTKTLTCTKHDSAAQFDVDTEIKFKFNKDEVDKISMKFDFDYGETYKDYMSQIRDSFDSQNQFKGYEGVTVSTSIKGTVLTATVTMDVDELDDDTKDDLEIKNFAGDVESVKKNAEKDGYTCKIS